MTKLRYWRWGLLVGPVIVLLLVIACDSGQASAGGDPPGSHRTKDNSLIEPVEMDGSVVCYVLHDETGGNKLDCVDRR